MKPPLIIYWSRRDLRLRDNRALLSAVNESKHQGIPFVPVFCIEPYMTQGDPKFQFGYPSRWLLAHALPAFAKHFETFELFHEKPVRLFKKIAENYDITIYVNEDIYPDFYTQIRKLRDHGISIKLFRDQLTIDKETVTGSGNYYSVFTPFKNNVWKSFVQEPEDKTPRLESVVYGTIKKDWGKQLAIATDSLLKLFSSKESLIINRTVIDIHDLSLPKRDMSEWYTNEQEALAQFDHYLKHGLAEYRDARDQLGQAGTSRMSLALAWGFVSARTLVQRIKKHTGYAFLDPQSQATSHQGAMHYISELIWREFYKYIAVHHPHLDTQPFQEKFKQLRWVGGATAKKRFIAWMTGTTGYPIVDAAMMQLATTGWMHNRARMIVASVLTKNFGIDWRWGQEYFRAMLVDLDETSNNGGWQWGASVGVDPKPIRIFNPYLQAKNYDADNAYVTKWLSPDYAKNPPEPIVPYEETRTEALERYGLGKKHTHDTKNYE